MEKRNFREMLEARWTEGKFVCVGLDSDLDKIPDAVKDKTGFPGARAISTFNRYIVEATHNLVCAYKPNVAFYEEHGAPGWEALRATIEHINEVAPDVPVVLDAKRADVGNTNLGYAAAIFDYLKADAVTVHPYLGAEALQPFLDRAEKGIFVLCQTSNPGAEEFQGIDFVVEFEEGKALEEATGSCAMSPAGRHAKIYEHVAYRVSHAWNKNNNCALVVGATYPSQLERVRKIVGDMPILIPGIGAQGGDIEKTVKAGKDSRGRGMIINSSRGIIFASSGKDFAEAAQRETLKLHESINQYL